jgi:multidrug resistance efflux pump
MRLSPKNIEIETLSEKHRINIAKYIYFAILIGIILILIVETGKMFSYITGYGEVLFPKTDIQPVNNIRLQNIYVSNYQKTYKGQILFKYIENEGSPSQSKLNKQIRAVKNEIIYYKKLLKKKEYQLNQMKKLSLLEVYMPSDLINKEHEIETIKSELLKAQTQIFPITRVKKIKTFYSPDSGIIGKIFFVKGEVIKSGETIMTIYKPNKIKIRGYFNQKYFMVLHIGQRVKIEFANGEQDYGTIENIYFITFPQPLQFRQTYQPYKRSIAVDIKPDIKSFKNNVYPYIYKTSVEIYIKKFKFPSL